IATPVWLRQASPAGEPVGVPKPNRMTPSTMSEAPPAAVATDRARWPASGETANGPSAAYRLVSVGRPRASPTPNRRVNTPSVVRRQSDQGDEPLSLRKKIVPSADIIGRNRYAQVWPA